MDCKSFHSNLSNYKFGSTGKIAAMKEEDNPLLMIYRIKW